MATKILPLFSDPYYSYEAELESKNYTLTFRFNERLNLYVLSIKNPDEETVIESLPLTPFFPLLKQYSLTELQGYFCLVPYQVPSDGGMPDLTSGSNVWETHFLVFEEQV